MNRKKALDEYSDKELDELIEQNEKKLRYYKALLHHTPETIKSSVETENFLKELYAERTRRLIVKKSA